MFTLVGFSESQDTAGALTYVAALQDQHVRVEGDNVIVPSALANLAGAYALGPTLLQAQVETPSLRRTLLLDLPVFEVGALPADHTKIFDLFYNPLPLDPTEPLRFRVAEGAAGAEREYGLVWLTDGKLAPVGGEIFTVRGTLSGTAVANAWTNLALTIGQTIPAGDYQVVGFSAHSANMIAARLVFVGGAARPGVLGAASEDFIFNPLFRRGGLGVWGEFEHSQPPTVDVLCSAADSSFVVYLDLLKVK